MTDRVVRLELAVPPWCVRIKPPEVVVRPSTVVWAPVDVVHPGPLEGPAGEAVLTRQDGEGLGNLALELLDVLRPLGRVAFAALELDDPVVLCGVNPGIGRPLAVVVAEEQVVHVATG